MVYSHAILSADQQAFFDADKPVILAHHSIRETIRRATGSSRWNTTGTIGAADATASDGPTKRVHDGHAHHGLHSKPNAAGPTWYLIFDLNSAPVTFDSVVLHGSNLYFSPESFKIEIADDPNFVTNKITVAEFSPGTTQTHRFIELEMDHTGGGASRQYSDVSYMRVEILRASAQDMVPRILEVWIGTRRQLSFLPEEPWDADRERSLISRIVSKSGIATSNRQTRSGAVRASRLMLRDGEDSHKALASFWDDSRGGTEPFYWIETPSSDPKPYLMRFDVDGNLDYDPILRGPLHRDFELSMVEQNPYLSQDP